MPFANYSVSDVKLIKSTYTGLRMEQSMIDDLSNLAKAHGVTYSAVIRRACREFLARQATEVKEKAAA
jgi:hypothetical protein